MICAIEQTMLFGSLVLLGLSVGFFVEEVATRMGYKPKNLLASWHAAHQAKRSQFVST